MVQEIEGSSTKAEFTTIDVSEIQGTSAKKQKPPFGPLLDLAMRVESGHIKSGAALQHKASAQATAPPDANQAAQKATARSELVEFTEKLIQPVGKPQQTANFSSGINMTDDVALDKLSVQDQISKLERITYGLKSSMFDKKHLKSIRNDVNTLNKQVIKERKRTARSNPTAVEQEFIKLRDHKLDEVMSMLSGAK